MSGAKTEGAFSNLAFFPLSPFVCACLNLSSRRQIQAFITTLITAALAHRLNFFQKEQLLPSLISPKRLPNTTVSLLVRHKPKPTATTAAMKKRIKRCGQNLPQWLSLFFSFLCG